MAVKFALELLFESVSARFVSESTGAANSFGWRSKGQNLPVRPRVCWIPGDDDSGDLGELGPPREPGRNPRPLATLGEVFTVYCEAFDATQPENEFAQYKAARLLFDAWWRAVHHAAHGTMHLTKPKLRWVIDKTERRHGAAIRALCSVAAMIPDTANAVASTTELEAEIDVTEKNVTETVKTTEELPP